MDRMALPPRHSRRAFIGMAAGAAAIPAGTSGCQSSGPGSASQHGTSSAASRHGPVSENSLPGYRDWDIKHVGGPDAIMGYAGQCSVLPGEPITLYVSTTSRSFTVKAFRMGWYHGDLARLVWRSKTVAGHKQSKPTLIKPANTVETHWEPALTVPTGDWPECSYLLLLDSEDGPQRFVPVTVRSARTAGKTVIKNGVATWQAYNTWGGHDLYNGPGGIADYTNRSLAVSLDRPYDQNGAYMFLFHERKLIALAERLGMPLAYVTGMDIEHEPRLLDGASALFSLGHDEYWSPPERANVTAARNKGVNLAFLGANCCFRRTRLAGTGVRKGTRFRGLVGIEYDRVNPDSPVEGPIEILSHSPLTCRGVNSYSDSAYYTHSSGAGVFNTGTMRWVASFGGWYRYGLDRHTARFTQRVTRNVLHAFADGPAAAKYPAHDNLAAMNEWAGDPIASHHNLWPPIHL